MDTVSSLFELLKIEHFCSSKKVLDIEHLELPANQIIGFFGPNGSGKTTLFSILSFVSCPTFGKLKYKNTNSRMLEQHLKQEVVLLPQNPYLLKRTVYDNIAFGLHLRKDVFNIEKRVIESLSFVGLDASFMHRKWNQLSGGESQRVALAARLILKPKVLILDEPTSGVDTNSAQLIKEAIFIANQTWDTTLFISSHDSNWLNHTCDKKIGLFQGKLLESENVNFLFAPWEKDYNGNLIKEFIDGQKLIFEDTALKKRDSIVMISAEDIMIHNQDFKGLNAHVLSVFKKPQEEEIFVEFSIGGIGFNAKISIEELTSKQLLPGSPIKVIFNTKKALWL
jgi:tungstate transport system ATP-binding protein